MVDDIRDIIDDLVLDLRDEFTEYEFKVNVYPETRNEHASIMSEKKINVLKSILYNSNDGYPGDEISEHFRTKNLLCKRIWDIGDVLKQMPEFRDNFTYRVDDSVGIVIYLSDNIKLHKRAGEN